MRKSVIFIMVFMFIMSQGAFAQWGKGQQTPRFQGEFKPVVGAWAEYQIKGTDQGPAKMKIAIVGKEGNAFWYETVNDGQGGRTIMKMLLSGDPNDQKGVTRMIMKNGNEQATEMPIMGMGQGKKPAKAQPPKGKVIDKGMETITVPAGTFTARHFQYQNEKEVMDTWSSEKVPPYNMVKSSAKDFTMVLVGFGAGAKTAITETPKKFQMPKMPTGMPPGMMPPGMGAPGKE
jgi:hypothetical protein